MKFRTCCMALAVLFAGGIAPQVAFAEDVPPPIVKGELTDEQYEKMRERFEERWNEKYENASDERKAKMDKRRAEFEALSEEEKRERMKSFLEKRKKHKGKKHKKGKKKMDCDKE